MSFESSIILLDISININLHANPISFKSLPSIKILPLVGYKFPAIIFKRIELPSPDFAIIFIYYSP